MMSKGEIHAARASRPLRASLLLGLLLLAGLGLSSCQAPSEIDLPLTLEATLLPTATSVAPTQPPPPPKTLVICMRDEPESLYLYSEEVLYGPTGAEANAVLQAIYDGPIDLVGGAPRAVILQSIPSIDNGGARLEAVAVNASEVYLNPLTFMPDNLELGSPYLPSGCRDTGCIQSYPGGEVLMDRLVADFRLREGLVWSDGEPLTAADSVFSFQLDAHPETPTTKYLVDRTTSYTVVDERTVRWIGIPGFMDPEYGTNFWSPLPAHLLADIEPGELPKVEAAARVPVGWGPYVIDSWSEGSLLLSPNPRYFRSQEGLPAFDRLLFRFLAGDGRAALQQILTKECDLVDSSLFEGEGLAWLADALELESEGILHVTWGPDVALARLDFNLDPIDGVRLLSDVRTRRALTFCLDRQGLADRLTYGLGVVPENALGLKGVVGLPGLPAYDPQAGAEQLEAVGWLDQDGDPSTARTALGVPDVRGGTELALRLVTGSSALEVTLAAEVQRGLEACGASVQVVHADGASLTTPWPEGAIFGRSFDLALWLWPAYPQPLCEAFAGWEIPSSGNPFGINAGGYANPGYDEACRELRWSLPGQSSYAHALERLLNALAEDLPSVPLLQPPRCVAHRSDLCGVQMEALGASDLWNLESLDLAPACP